MTIEYALVEPHMRLESFADIVEGAILSSDTPVNDFSCRQIPAYGHACKIICDDEYNFPLVQEIARIARAQGFLEGSVFWEHIPENKRRRLIVE